MKIGSLQTNHRCNPIGCALGRPSVSWIVTEAKGKREKAAKIRVALDAQFENIVFDSGKIQRDGVVFPLPIETIPRTRYYWSVQVWDDTGDTAISETAWFETGKMQEKWNAKWIAPDWEIETCHPYLGRIIDLPAAPVRARAYVTGVGLYELSVNGEKAGDEVLLPGYNAYDKWIQTQSFDITGLLKAGKNSVEALMGNGWYKGDFSYELVPIYGKEFALIAEMHIDLANGDHIVIGTDKSWETRPSVIRSSGIYEGEVQDYTADLSKEWPVKTIDMGFDRLEDRLSPLLRIQKELKPVQLLHTPSGETVLDMGQNMVGWLRCRLTIPKGKEVIIQFGEILQAGNFFNKNLAKARQEFRFIGDGKGRTYEPHFTFYGFRYAKITGIEVDINDFTGCVIHSEIPQIGHIETSDASVNRLFLNVLWSQKGNFIDTPTDCPQRSERMGWTGDAQVFSGTALFNTDCAAFYEKFMHDVWMEQKANNGVVPHVVPSLKAWEHGLFKLFMLGSSGWSDVATIVPWQVYLHTGDPAILERQFESMKAWVDSIRRQDDGSHLWKSGFHFGDWLSQDTRDVNYTFGGTPMYFIASCFYAWSSELTGKAAEVIGKKEEAEFYLDLTEKIKEAMRGEFISPNGRVGLDSQTASVMALKLSIVKPEHRSRVAAELAQKISAASNHLTTGFIGTPHLMSVLSENGENGTAYRLLMKRDFPSWLYEVDMGATTVWERWNSVLPDGKVNPSGMNSLNHYSFGSVVEWMYSYMCGINPVEKAPGFRRAVIAPKPYGLIEWAKAEVNTASGKYVCGWKIEKENLKLHVEIPFNSAATLVLPEGCTLGGKSELELSAGVFDYDFQPSKPYYIRYSITDTLQVLMDQPKAKEIVVRYLPALGQYFSALSTEMKNTPLCNLVSLIPPAPISQDNVKKLNKELSSIIPGDK